MSNADESAFPIPVSELPGAHFPQYGLTKREWLAGIAMQGLCAVYPQGGSFMEQHIAKGAVSIADALLAELAKQG
jgi:hypothetical protein